MDEGAGRALRLMWAAYACGQAGSGIGAGALPLVVVLLAGVVILPGPPDGRRPDIFRVVARWGTLEGWGSPSGTSGS